MKNFDKQRFFLMVFCSALILCSLIFGWILSERLYSIAETRYLSQSTNRVYQLAAIVNWELNEVDHVVKTMAASPEVVAALAGRQPPDIAQAYRILDRYQEALDKSILYLMNPQGEVIASTNRNEFSSFVGKNYRFRPYFKEAIRGGRGHYFALGVTSKRRGYYSSLPVKSASGAILGVAIIKQDIEQLSNIFNQFEHCFFVDPNGVIFWASKPQDTFRTLGQFSQDQQKQLQDSKQFGSGPFEPLTQESVEDGAKIQLAKENYFVNRHFFDSSGWSIVLLTSERMITLHRYLGWSVSAFVFLLSLSFIAFLILNYQTFHFIQEREERFAQIALATQDMIWETDKEGRYTYVNEAAVDSTGYSSEELIGKSLFGSVIKSKNDPEGQLLEKAFSRREAFKNFVISRLDKDNNKKIILTSGIPALDAKKCFKGFRGVDHDLTDQVEKVVALKKANAELRDEERALRNILYDLQNEPKEDEEQG